MKKISHVRIIIFCVLMFSVKISYALLKNQSELFGRIEINVGVRNIKNVEVKEIEVGKKVFKKASNQRWKWNWEWEKIASTTVNRYNRYFFSLPPDNYEFKVSLVITEPGNRSIVFVKKEVVVYPEPTEKNWIVKITSRNSREPLEIFLEEELEQKLEEQKIKDGKR